MGANKRGSGADPIYSEHLYGAGAFNANSGINRERAIERLHQITLTNLAVNRFEWKNLPPTIDPRFLEMILFFQALAVVYWDTDYDQLLAVRGSGVGYVNMLDNPVSFQVIGPGTEISATSTNVEAPAVFRNKTVPAYMPQTAPTLTDEELKLRAVPVWASYLRTPDIDIVNMYAKRLAWIDRTLEINTKNARRNKILKGTANTQLSTVNFARAVDQGEELLQVTGALADMDFIEALDLSITPDSYEKLALLRTRIWNECIELLGITNSNADKKERMVAAEIGANDDKSASMRYVALNARQYAAEQINKIHGLNIEVDFKTEIEKQEAIEESQAVEKAEEQKEGGDNGDVHSETP